METCHEYGLLAALTLVPFHVFVGARSFHVFQKRCSREAVGFFVVPVSYLFRCFVLRGLAWLVKMPIIASVPKCVFHPASSIPRDQQRNVFRKIQVTKWYVPPFFSSYSLLKSQDQTIQMSFCPNSAPSEVVVWDERALAKFMDERLMSPEWLEKCRFYSFLFHTCNHVITIRWFHDIPGCTWSTKRAVKHHDIRSILLRHRLCARGAASSHSDDACAATTCPVCSRWTTTTTSACRCIDASFSMLFLNVLRLTLFSAFLCLLPFDLSLQYCLSHSPFKLYQIMISHVLFALKNASRDSPRSLDELPRSERALLSLFQAQCTIWLPLALRIHNSNIAHMFAIEISRFQIPFVFFSEI